ncbi:flagellar hook assembly protein FlgD [Paenibacillus chartarius]|uniref:Flagellar hook assembly protein FlgD n=1 Tax=Paenibacillus chartarius TaxID=747481 RepID=A0ABV6DNY0_9BACL
MASVYTPPVGDPTKTTTATSTTPASKAGQSSLGKDDFLKILITQLKNQDPMQPMQDKDFIAQMAQFSSLEQMTNVASTLAQLPQMLGYASSLIGKTISWISTDEADNGEIKSGQVDSIILKDGKQYAAVEGENVGLDQVTQVALTEAAE